MGAAITTCACINVMHIILTMLINFTQKLSYES